jgi:hypothetical protein
VYMLYMYHISTGKTKLMYSSVWPTWTTCCLQLCSLTEESSQEHHGFAGANWKLLCMFIVGIGVGDSGWTTGVGPHLAEEAPSLFPRT